MKNKDLRIDAYISKAADFAKPILIYLRELVHETCPDVVETIKWGMPYFDYKGVFCGMASFKAHCSFGFWKAPLMKNAAYLLENQEKAMGHLGKITSMKDLPSEKMMIAMLKDAMQINENGISLPAEAKKIKKDVPVPDILQKNLKKNKAAMKYFTGFSPSQKREYCMWIDEAKTEATRLKRTEQAIEWMAEGKTRNWKYEKPKK